MFVAYYAMYFKLFMHICCIYVAVTAYAYLMHVQVVSVTALSQQARGEPEMFKLSLENRENNIQDVTVAYFVHIFMQILCIFCSYFTYSSFLHNFLHIVHICCIFFAYSSHVVQDSGAPSGEPKWYSLHYSTCIQRLK